MKQLVFDGLNLGGHPVDLDNFRHLQDALIESVQDIVKSIAGLSVPVVIQGGITTGVLTSLTWTSGTMFDGNELLRFPAQGTNVSNATHGLFIKDDFPLDHPIVYESGNDYNIERTRTLEVKLLAGNPAPDFVLDDLLKNIQEAGWTNLAVTSGVGAIIVQPQVRMIGKLVEFRGRFDITINNWSFVLPAQFQPVLGGNSTGVQHALITQRLAVKEVHAVETVPFGGGSLEGSVVVGAGLFPKTIDISTFRYYLP